MGDLVGHLVGNEQKIVGDLMGHLMGETTGVLAPRALHAARRVPCGALWAPSTVLPEGTQELQSVDPTKVAAAACTHHHPQPASPWRASIQPQHSRNRPPAKQIVGDPLCGSYGTPEVTSAAQGHRSTRVVQRAAFFDTLWERTSVR